MKLFRNDEVRKTFRLLCLLTLLFPAAGFLAGKSLKQTTVGATITAAAVFCCCSILCGIFYLFTNARYRKLARLSRDIDQFLHNGGNLRLSEYAEGELAILSSEVEKMTLRLRKQSEKLIADKQYLADSLADISHQLRTPLTAMNLLLAVLYNPETPPEKRREAAAEMRKLLGRIDWLISALLKISRLDADAVVFRKEKVFVEQLIRQAYDPVAVPMELKEQKFLCQIDPEISYAGDLRWSAEAVGNILKNCMEHTPSGGTITVTAKKNGIFTEIVIRDSGPGIDPEDLPHLFERFYKGKNSSEQSFGIGLALAQMIIVRQNGIIKASNGKNGGAEFTLRFYDGIV